MQVCGLADLRTYSQRHDIMIVATLPKEPVVTKTIKTNSEISYITFLIGFFGSEKNISPPCNMLRRRSGFCIKCNIKKNQSEFKGKLHAFFGQFTWLHRILLIIIHALTYSLPQCDVATFLWKTVSLLKRQKGKCLDLCLMCLG